MNCPSLKSGWRNTVSISSKELFQKIRVGFLFNHPFLSVLALSLETVYAQNTRSAFQTNGSALFIDSEKLQKYSDKEITYLYAHTLLHVALKHPFRRRRREKSLWNMSCDVVINNILADFDNVGIMPNDEIIDKDLQNMCVEEVYEYLDKKKQEEKRSGTKQQDDKDETSIYDETKMDLDEVNSEKEDTKQREKLDAIIVQALAIAKNSSKTYAGLKVEIDTILKPEIDISNVIREFLSASLFEKEVSFSRPNRRFIHSNIYLPGVKKSQELIEVYIALDSSSSVSLEEYKKFLGVIVEICSSFYEYKITVLPFDKSVKSEYIVSFDSFNPLSQEDLYIPKSDGGTDFDAFLRYLKQIDMRGEKLLMVLSDGEFEISESLVCKTVFLISLEKNIEKFKRYGRVIKFKV